MANCDLNCNPPKSKTKMIHHVITFSDYLCVARKQNIRNMQKSKHSLPPKIDTCNMMDPSH